MERKVLHVKKCFLIMEVFLILFLLSACGEEAINEEGNAFVSKDGAMSDSQLAEKSHPSEELKTSPPSQTPDLSQIETAPPEEEADQDSPTEESDLVSSSDVEEARQAAMTYYAGTVFEIHSLTRIEPWGSWKGDVLFRVACSKGGEPQVDRTIALERQDGSWVVVGEGY